MVRWPLQTLQPLQKTQLQPPFGPSVDSPCHPWFTTTNLSFWFLIVETSATALCGTTGSNEALRRGHCEGSIAIPLFGMSRLALLPGAAAFTLLQSPLWEPELQALSVEACACSTYPFSNHPAMQWSVKAIENPGPSYGALDVDGSCVPCAFATRTTSSRCGTLPRKTHWQMTSRSQQLWYPGIENSQPASFKIWFPTASPLLWRTAVKTSLAWQIDRWAPFFGAEHVTCLTLDHPPHTSELGPDSRIVGWELIRWVMI